MIERTRSFGARFGKARSRANVRLFAALMAGSALTLPGAAMAQSWDGSESTDINAAGNWTNDRVPDSSASVEVNTDTNPPVIGADQAAQVRSINVGPTNTAMLTVRERGRLTIGTPTNGGSLTVGGSQTTNVTTGNGTVRVTGAGSSIFINGGLDVAITPNSRGLVEILDGASITGAAFAIATAAGTVTISGAGSRWDNGSGSGLFIGNLTDFTGSGTLNVLDGGAYVALAANTSVNVRHSKLPNT